MNKFPFDVICVTDVREVIGYFSIFGTKINLK